MPHKRVTKTKPCIHPGCIAVLGPDQIACHTHWMTLPPTLRARIYASWQNRGLRSPGYLRGVSAARTWWAEHPA